MNCPPVNIFCSVGLVLADRGNISYSVFFLAPAAVPPTRNFRIPAGSSAAGLLILRSVGRTTTTTTRSRRRCPGERPVERALSRINEPRLFGKTMFGVPPWRHSFESTAWCFCELLTPRGDTLWSVWPTSKWRFESDRSTRGKVG